MFNCSDCDYKTERKYNLQSHVKRKHKRGLKEEEKVKKEDKEKKDNGKNVKNINTFEKNINTFGKNINTFEKNINTINNELKCSKCNKIFKSKNGLKYHIIKCNGVLNKLECPYCHKILSSSASKSRHIKTCRVKMSSLIEVKKEEEENKQTTIINNINNGTINNNNINIINFNYNDYIEFIRTHINAEEMNKMLRESKNEDVIIEYFNKLYKNPLNRCIKRESERNGKSKIKIGEEWKEEMNKIVYPKLSLSVSKSLNEHLEDLFDEEKIKKSLSNIASDISTLTDDIMDKAPEIEIQQLKKRIIKVLQFKLLSY
jgi:hypothetical protein